MQLKMDPPLPHPYSRLLAWVKADMLYTVGAERLTCPHLGRTETGKKKYLKVMLSDDVVEKVLRCVVLGLGIEAGIEA